ncbi:hypothetical protein C5167_044332 [Papaver somniferum]|uniref:Uncharacterized protein n=1 Tax=Papaver somniferum TaxID=3469 RepID=A0A4Y7L9U5_PAPSO|nr:hypothetical protein C5167_044332 [Papaver somniferum]
MSTILVEICAHDWCNVVTPDTISKPSNNLLSLHNQCLQKFCFSWVGDRVDELSALYSPILGVLFGSVGLSYRFAGLHLSLRNLLLIRTCGT